MTSVQNIASHLTQRALVAPYQIALYAPTGQVPGGKTSYQHLTYAQLDAEVNLLAQGFIAEGLQPGTRVAMMVPPSLPFFVLTFALFRAGLVPIFIDPGMGIKNLKRCIAEAKPEIFIGTSKAHLARLLFGWGRASLTRRLQVGDRSFFFGVTPLADVRAAGMKHPRVDTSVQELDLGQHVAAILFTSGSTGAPKGVIYGHAQFNAQIAALKALFQFQPGEVDLSTFPLFGLFAPALAMTGVIPQMDFTRPAQVDAAKIFAAVDDFGISNLFGSPALLRALANAGVARGVTLPSLRRVISAGAAVDPKILRQAVRLLRPDAQIFTPYGATEVLPVACIGSDEILGETAAGSADGRGICVGKPAPGVRLQVIAIHDQVIGQWSDQFCVPQGVVGEIVVDAPQVTVAYDSRPEATALAKIPRDGAAVMHRMGDLGYLDDQGRLWFCGRKSHRLKLPTGDMYTEICEGIFNAQPKVYRSALVGRGAPGQMVPVLCVEADEHLKKEQKLLLSRALRQTALAHPATRAVEEFRFYDGLPVDIRHNSKIFREQLKVEVDRA
ncbi:MAG: fatty acid CoA ligase family protein [Proteobacteria bacterium]|nr:fatty acid CoA ligase family protein [Pseudomonadota bacterium]